MPLYALYAFFQSSPAIWSLIAVSSSIISYLFFASPKLQSSSSKAQRAKVMKQAFKAIENQTIAPKNVETSKVGDLVMYERKLY